MRHAATTVNERCIAIAHRQVPGGLRVTSDILATGDSVTQSRGASLHACMHGVDTPGDRSAPALYLVGAPSGLYEIKQAPDLTYRKLGGEKVGAVCKGKDRHRRNFATFNVVFDI